MEQKMHNLQLIKIRRINELMLRDDNGISILEISIYDDGIWLYMILK